ncbi:MAG TPA: endo alpha-1,4 polygalactosaminidase [Solirubrobacterales bacterium]|nr:endo alpha-1,4 polygalactosaminidase [Solirubrobacterales bacterium]
MGRLAGIVTVVAACATVALAGASREPVRDPSSRDLPAESFAFAIGNGMLSGGPAEVAARLGAFDLVVVDGELAREDEVSALRAQGATVLGYLSVGTIEKWRSWYPRLKRFRLTPWQDWKDEWFADTSKAAYRREITRRIAPSLVGKGFDGLFLDTVDMIETRNHRAQRPGMRKIVLALSRLVHADGRLLFTQNGHWGLGKLRVLGAIDGWNREDVTWTYDFDRRRYVPNPPRQRRAALRELRDMVGRGLTVTATDYTRAGDEAARATAIANACAAGALPYVSDIGLTARRLPAPPLTCGP